MVWLSDTLEAMPAGVLNMPDPMVAPMAIMVRANSDSPRCVEFMVVVFAKPKQKKINAYGCSALR
jgi:hypothetical protein